MCNTAYMLLWGQHTHIDQQNVFDVGIYFNIESIYDCILYCSIKELPLQRGYSQCFAKRFTLYLWPSFDFS